MTSFFRQNFAKHELARLWIVYLTTKDRPRSKPCDLWSTRVGGQWNLKNQWISPSLHCKLTANDHGDYLFESGNGSIRFETAFGRNVRRVSKINHTSLGSNIFRLLDNGEFRYCNIYSIKWFVRTMRHRCRFGTFGSITDLIFSITHLVTVLKAT